MKKFRDRIATAIQYQMPPLTWEDIRHLFFLAYGDEAPRTNKRCQKCGGDGTTRVALTTRKCGACKGTGYE